MNLQNKEAEYRKRMQLLFLIAAGIVIYSFMLLDGVFPGRGYYLAEKYMAVPTLLFLGSALSQRLNPVAKKCVLLSVVTVLWFVITQTHHWLTGMTTRNFGIFAVVYLLAFPYAAVTEDGKKNLGLNWVGSFYVAYGVLMTIFAGLLLLDAVPEPLASCITWQGTRIALYGHPNVSGCTLMMGIGFTLYFLTRSEKKWAKCLLLILAALQFCALILTNSRTTIIVTCALFGGTVFFMIWNGGWKRFAAGAAVALAVTVGLFSLSGAVYELHTEVQVQKAIRQQEALETSTSGQQLRVDEETGEVSIASASNYSQGELSQDMKTLNGRIYIWKAAFEALRDNRSICLWGTEYAGAEISYRSNFKVTHSHNSWIEALMVQGVPGLLLALVYTVIAVWNIWTLLWRKDTDRSKKVVAMLLICILMASIMEPYLFIGAMDTNYANFFFFLSTGYLIQWNRPEAQTE